MEPISPRLAQRADDEDYKLAGAIPHGFNPSDPENIKKFSANLKAARAAAKLSLKAVSLEAGVSAMALSKYENGKMKSIPLQRIRRLSVAYGATPHYLLGLTQKPESALCLDPETNQIVRNADGTQKEIIFPMQFLPISFQEAVDAYRNLYDENRELFFEIAKFINQPSKKQDAFLTILKVLPTLT